METIVMEAKKMLLMSPSWQHREAALFALFDVSHDASVEERKPLLSDLIPCALDNLNHPVVGVLFCVCCVCVCVVLCGGEFVTTICESECKRV